MAGGQKYHDTFGSPKEEAGWLLFHNKKAVLDNCSFSLSPFLSL